VEQRDGEYFDLQLKKTFSHNSHIAIEMNIPAIFRSARPARQVAVRVILGIQRSIALFRVKDNFVPKYA
jgi:hypothetical protein